MDKLHMRALSAVFQAREIEEKASNQADSSAPKERELRVCRTFNGGKARPVIVAGYLNKVEHAVVIPLYSTNKEPMKTSARLVLFSLKKYKLKSFSQVGADNTTIVPIKDLKKKFSEIDMTDYELIRYYLLKELWLFRMVQLHILTNSGDSITEANTKISEQIETEMDFVNEVSKLC